MQSNEIFAGGRNIHLECQRHRNVCGVIFEQMIQAHYKNNSDWNQQNS